VLGKGGQMGREPPTLVLVWGLALLAAVVTLVLVDAPIPVVLALIACLPRRPGSEVAPRRADGKTND
jgi:hypothetical protein